MKKYEGIILPIYRPWDLEKFPACPARWGEGGERKDMKHVNILSTYAFRFHVLDV